MPAFVQHLPLRKRDGEMIHRLHRTQVVFTPLDDIWVYFSSPKNLNAMTPPYMKFEIIHGGDNMMFQGQMIEYRVQLVPMVSSRWLTEITHVEEKVFFIDEQRIGPYRFWHHEHRFETIKGGTEITDQVTYKLPCGPLGDLIHSAWIRNQLKQIFNYRHEKIQEIFA